jgi:DNA-binding transcriptional ArsR family regulator
MKIKFKKNRSAAAEKIDCIKALRALGDPRRIKILNILLTEPLTAGTIAERCGLTAYTASRQLSALHRAGLLDCNKDGQRRLYSIAGACNVLIDRSARTLSLNCCQFRLDAIDGQ